MAGRPGAAVLRMCSQLLSWTPRLAAPLAPKLPSPYAVSDGGHSAAGLRMCLHVLSLAPCLAAPVALELPSPYAFKPGVCWQVLSSRCFCGWLRIRVACRR